MAMRNKTLYTAMLVVALAAAACSSSEPETVTTAAPADESPPTTAQDPVEGDPSDGGASDSDESGASGDEDSGASSSSSSDDAGSAYSDEDSGVSTSSSSDDADAASGSPDDTVSVTQDQVGDGADISDPGPSNSGEPVPPLDQRDLAYITNVAFQVLESWPAQVIVEVSGELPDPCHQPWWEVGVDGNTYDVQVWSVSPPPGAEIACAQVVEPFTENVPLGGGFVDDEYTVIVNGQPHSLTF